MKKKLLLLFVCLFGALGGVKAYTTANLESAGWTKVTAISNDASNENYVGNFVYVLVDAGSSNYLMSGETTTVSGYVGIKPTYRTLANPCVTPYFVWTLEVRNGGFAMRNIVSAQYFNSNGSTDGTTKGLGWEDTMSDDYPAGTFTFTINSGKYSIQGVSSELFVGPWNNNGAVKNDGEAIAANKSDTQAPDFFIYRMAKATYAQKYLQQCPNVTFPVDMTYLIVNPTIYSATQATSTSRAVGSDVAIGQTGWTAWKSLRNNNNYTAGSGNTVLEAWSGGWKMNIDYYQKIASLPSGKYSVTAKTHFNKNSESGNAYVYVYGSYINDKKRSDDAISIEEADFSTQYIDVASGYINIGVETPEEITQSGSTALYLTADNFRLNADPYISTMATELPDGGAMTAGLWYSFSVDATGNYDLSGSTALDDIIYTTGSTTALKDAGSTKFTATMTLTAGETYYLRSSSDNTFSAVPDIATASQELPNSAVTVGDWYRFTTGNSSDAYVLSSTGNATVTYTTDGTIFSNADINDTWTLTNKLNILLAPSTTYYIKSNAAVTLTKTETSVSSSFVTGWTKVTSSEQLADNPTDYFFAIFSANNTGLYLINRNEANNEKLRYVTAGDPLRNGASLFEVENFDGDFVLKSAVNGKYFENRPIDGQDRPGIGEEDGPWNYHADLTEKDENCRTTLSFHDGVCTIQDKNDHNGNRYIGLWYVDHDYANNEILAGNKSEAEKASFIIYRIPKDDCDFNNLIQNADFSSTTGWTEYKSAEYVNMGNGLIGTFKPTGSTAATVDETHLATEYCIGFQARWNTNYTAYQQTTATLPSGHYVLSYDVEDVNNSSTKINYDNLFFVQIGDDKYIDESTEWMNAGKSPWTTHSIAFDLDEASAVKISLGYGNKEDKNTTPIIYVSHLKLEYSSYADDGDYAELNAAISAAESKTLGFETGEYAPYNNADALTKLEAAKAIDQDESNLKSDVEKATSDLTSATWTANEEDVDAICNGSFTGIARGTQDNEVPGWDGGVFRMLITTEDYAALSASKEGRAMFSYEKTYVYGSQTGYTMPLKRNTKYALSFKAAGWKDGNIGTVSAVVKKPDGSTLKTLNITPEKRISEDGSLVSGRVEFTVETSGNYTLEVTVPASTLAVITDFSIERLGIPVLMQVSGIAKMGTFCAPFNVEIPSGVKAYTLSDGTSDDWVHMDEVKGTTIAAGTPVLLTSDTKVEQEFVGQMTVLKPNNDGLLKGVFEKTEVAPDANNYILQYQDSKCAFYIVSDADIYIGKNRCYLHVAKTSARIAIDREEDGFTGINEVKSVEAEARTMKDGKYFVKGRIIVVKNGKVYGTNGQILN